MAPRAQALEQVDDCVMPGAGTSRNRMRVEGLTLEDISALVRAEA